MPIYEYKCGKCGEKFELRRGFNDIDNDIKCIKCGEQDVRRVLSVFGVSSGGSGSESSGPSIVSSGGGCGGHGGFS